MAQDDQEALAAQWAAELEKEAQGGDAAPAAAQPVGGPGAAGQTAAAPTGDAKQDEEALAAQWAEALAKDEEGKESAPKDNAGLAGPANPATISSNASWTLFWTFPWTFQRNWGAPACSSMSCCSWGRARWWSSTNWRANRWKSTSTASW